LPGTAVLLSVALPWTTIVPGPVCTGRLAVMLAHGGLVDAADAVGLGDVGHDLDLDAVAGADVGRLGVPACPAGVVDLDDAGERAGRVGGIGLRCDQSGGRAGGTGVDRLVVDDAHDDLIVDVVATCRHEVALRKGDDRYAVGRRVVEDRGGVGHPVQCRGDEYAADGEQRHQPQADPRRCGVFGSPDCGWPNWRRARFIDRT
jgi:hypothetical protein